MTTEQKKLPQKKGEKTTEKLAGSTPKKPRIKPAAQSATKRGNTRRKSTPKPKPYDHIPIIIALLVIFSLTLLCIGVGLTHYLTPERAGIPACGQLPCSSPFSAPLSQKGGGE
ncbi:MAG: hypothetical protein D3920_00190 [Candidatus Electrothrix sp. AW2]|nr:hypothetical protein [Candidatus Electrothrix sp. AX1]MCI5133497.1 hypothetical protein [Candidatus Electrothrix gigas]